MCDSHQPLNGADSDNRCLTCGEPPMIGFDGAEFGHFTTDEGTFCQRCGSDPAKAPRKRKVAV